MTDLERVTKVIDWFIFENIAENQRDLAKILGYTESSLSQIVNGKVKLSPKFIKKLSNLDARINDKWVLDEEGDMILVEKNISKTNESLVKENKVDYGHNYEKLYSELLKDNRLQRDIIFSQQETINRLTEMLYEENQK